jgi:rhodanese-related sulfurtransferase
MPSPTEISVSQLARLIGQPNAPAIVDVRTDSDYAEDPRLVPGSLRRNAQEAAIWARDVAGSNVIVVCQHGRKLSQGAAAWLRHGHRVTRLAGPYGSLGHARRSIASRVRG